MNRIKYIKNNCPICPSSQKYKFKNFLRKDIFPTSLGTFFFKLKDEICLNCGLVYSNPIPNQKSLNNFYTKKFLNKNLKPDYDLKNQLSFIFKNFSKEQKILEVGSSNKFLIKELKSAGYSAKGYDLLDNQNLKSAKYDVILLNHVLEHTSNPIQFLKKIKKLCKAKANVVIEVPNVENYFKSETSVLTCEHNYHFNKFNLIKMLQKVGFNFKFHEKKKISRKFSLRLIFENSLKNDFYQIKSLKITESLEKKKIKLIKNIFNKMLCKKSLSNNNLIKLSKKLKLKIKNKNTKLICWGANAIFLNCYLNFSNEILRYMKLVDINYLHIKYLKLPKKKFLVESPLKFINKSNIYLICSLSWHKEIKKDLMLQKVSAKNIYLAS